MFQDLIIVTTVVSHATYVWDTAPENFKMNDDDSNAFVYKQPENDKEREACEEALESCPVDAIGNDG